MRYKSRVQQLVDNLENLLDNMVKNLQEGRINERDALDTADSAHKTTKSIMQLIQLEDEDFNRTSDSQAPGTKEAPTPSRSSRRTQPRGDTKRVSNTEEANETKRVNTEGGHNRKKRTTKRVEFDD